MERGRGGKGEREGWEDHLPYFPPVASASNTTLPIRSVYAVRLKIQRRTLFNVGMKKFCAVGIIHINFGLVLDIGVLAWLHVTVLLYAILLCASGCVIECRTCNREVAGSNLSLGYFTRRSTQPSIPPGSVNEYQLRLGRQRQVWLIPIADERVGVQVKL